MTPAAEKDIRSALRQLRGCQGRLAMARTGRLDAPEAELMVPVRTAVQLVEECLVKMLTCNEGTKR